LQEGDLPVACVQQDHSQVPLVGSETQFQFGQRKYTSLPQACLKCPVLFVYNGECPKNRFIRTLAGEPGLNYLCAGYKAFFQRVDETMRVLATLDRPAEEVMEIMSTREEELWRAYQKAKPDRPCPCSSGLTFQECHGWSRPSHSHRKRAKPAGCPRPPVCGAPVHGA
jgi:uncharacterized protein